MDDWYYVVSGQSHGPISRSVLTDNIQKGLFAKDVFVWRNGMAAWTKASEVAELSTKSPETFLLPVPVAELDPQAANTHSPDRPSNATGSESTWWRKFIVLLVLAIVAALIGKMWGAMVGVRVAEGVQQSQATKALSEGLAQAADEMQPKLPMRFDARTQLTSVHATGNKLTYVLQMNENIADQDVNVYKDVAYAVAEFRTCQNEFRKKLVAAGAILEWTYTHKGRIVANSRVTACP